MVDMSVQVHVIDSTEQPTMKKGMGFKKAANSISDVEKVPIKVANKILASRTRNASPAAKKANPNLKKVK